MHFSAGQIPMGRCEGLDGEFVFTRFFFLGPFLVPLETIYMLGLSPDAPRFHVKRHGTSIALAYLRWVVAPITLLIVFIAFAGNAEGPPALQGSAVATLAAVVAIWLALVFLTARTWGRAARERRVLASCVGVAVRPEILFDGTLSLVIDHLERAWKELSVGEGGGQAWRELYPKDVVPVHLPLYYALCRYDAALTGDPISRNRSRLAFARIDADFPKFESLMSYGRAKRPQWVEDLTLSPAEQGYTA
jgi:hypothetical protein